MKKILLLTLSLSLISSCAYINKTNKNKSYIQEIMSLDNEEIDNIHSQIQFREEEVNKINSKISELNSHISKLSQRVDIENKFITDSSSMEKHLYDTKKELNKYKLKCEKLKREIRVLKRKL